MASQWSCGSYWRILSANTILACPKREYSNNRKETMAQAKSLANKAISPNRNSRHKIPSKRGSKLSLGIHRDLMGHHNSAVQQGAFGLLDPAETIDQGPRSRGQRLRAHPRMSVNNGKNVGSPLGRGNIRRNRYDQPNVLVLQPSNSKRKDGNTDMPDVQYTFQEVSASQEKELRRWLMQMGFTIPSYKRNASFINHKRSFAKRNNIVCPGRDA